MCFKASSKRTSPVGVSDFNMIFLVKKNYLLFKTFFNLVTLKKYLEHRPRRLIPAFSSSTRPLRPNSIKIHPRRPLDMQSFQNEV